jgi:hypothetical protein
MPDPQAYKIFAGPQKNWKADALALRRFQLNG